MNFPCSSPRWGTVAGSPSGACVTLPPTPVPPGFPPPRLPRTQVLLRFQTPGVLGHSRVRGAVSELAGAGAAASGRGLGGF